MLSRILAMLPEGNRKFPLRYMRMVNSIRDRMCLARNRYLLAHPIQTPGIELLRFLCLNLDIAALDKYTSDADRYTEVIKFFKDEYRASVDPNFSNTIAGGRWIDKRGGVGPSEIILSCESTNPLTDLPFDKDWNEWRYLRAVRLLYHDSLELPEDFAKSMFLFKEQKPDYLVVSINVPILLFKYYKYTVACRKDNLQVNTAAFLKDSEYTYFFDDLYDIWTLNILLRIFENPDSSADEIIKDVTMPIRFCTANMLRQGLDGIKEFVDLLRQGALKPQDFLAIHWFAGRSILDMLTENEHWVQLPPTHRYLWLDSIHWMPWYILILEIIRMFQDGPLKDAVNIRCIEIWNRKFRTVYMPGAVINPALGDFIRQLQAEIGKIFKNEPIVFPKSRRRQNDVGTSSASGESLATLTPAS